MNVYALLFVSWLFVFGIIVFMTFSGKKKDKKKSKFEPSEEKKDDTFTDPTYKGLGYNIFNEND